MAGRARSETLLRTKFAVPRGPRAIVVRPRLFDALDAAVEAPLTLVAAPAGAGKSALVSSWIAAGRAPGPVAWLSLDADDADRRRFWRAVLQTLGRATRDDALRSLDVSPREPPELEQVLPPLFDALDGRAQPIVLVLDDFEDVAHEVADDLERLIRFPAPELRVVVITRVDPPIALGRLRLDGRVSEVRAADLAFSLEEASSLLEGLGVALESDELAGLWQRTEGWAAGLRLAGLSLRDHPEPRAFIDRFAGTDAAVGEYLFAEVLSRQPPEQREFLLRTSIVDLLNADLAHALVGSSNADHFIAQVERGGALLTPLDEHGTWHRYHPLFAELLRARLRTQLGDEVNELHRRAAVWFSEHGTDAAALRHAAAGEAWDLAWEIAVNRWTHLLVDGEMSALQPLLDAMPAERVGACPELSLALGAAMLERGDASGAEPYLRRAMEGKSSVPPERRALFLAMLAATGLYEARFHGDPAARLATARELISCDGVLEGVGARERALVLVQLGITELWTGQFDAAPDHLKRARAAAAEGRLDWTCLAADAGLAIVHCFRGEVTQALRNADAAIALAERRGWTRSEPAGMAYVALAASALHRGRPDEAAPLVARASEALSEKCEPSLRAMHAYVRSLLLADRGEPQAALEALYAARDAIGAWPLLPQLDRLLVAREGTLRAAVGDREAAETLLQGANDGTGASLPVANALARLRLLDGDAAGARAALGSLGGADHRLPSGAAPMSQVEAWVLDGLVRDALGEHDQSARSLERALELAEPGGITRYLLELGNLARPVLRRHMRWETAHPALVSEALEAIERRNGDGSPRQILFETLSERELAILHYLPTMKSNREIADELFVSVNTVKSHLKAIYRKLDVEGRREAVARGRELRLLL
jgi:LuxR family transcriptional regulator, maltose regulon positive regulatory protein